MLGAAGAEGSEPTSPFALGSTNALPFPTGAFDAAVCALLFDHLPAIDATVGELARVVRPGGRLLISNIHPAMTLVGANAAFRDVEDESHFMRSHLHPVSTYLRVVPGSRPHRRAVRRTVLGHRARNGEVRLRRRGRRSRRGGRAPDGARVGAGRRDRARRAASRACRRLLPCRATRSTSRAVGACPRRAPSGTRARLGRARDRLPRVPGVAAARRAREPSEDGSGRALDWPRRPRCSPRSTRRARSIARPSCPGGGREHAAHDARRAHDRRARAHLGSRTAPPVSILRSTASCAQARTKPRAAGRSRPAVRDVRRRGRRYAPTPTRRPG